MTCTSSGFEIDLVNFYWTFALGIAKFHATMRPWENSIEISGPPVKPKDAKRDQLDIANCHYDITKKMLIGHDGVVINLRNQSQKVLNVLALQPNVIVGKDEIIAEVWAQTFVSDDNLTQCIKDIRRAISDDNREVIKTIVGRGYMLVADVNNAAIPASVPIIYVDAIRVRVQNPTVLELADEITERILTALSSRRGMKVTTDPSDVTEADYLITGNARLSGNRLSVFMSLTDQGGDGKFFTERFESKFSDISEFASVVAQKVTNVLRVSGIAQFGKRFLHIPDADLNAQQLLAKAAYHYGKITPEATLFARETLQALVDRTPDDPMALAMLAATAVHMCPHVPHCFDEAEADRALSLAERAIYLAPDVDYVFRTRGNLKFWLNRDLGGAIEDCQRAIEITPFFQLAHLTLAEAELFSGSPIAARQRIQTMLTVEPYLPQYPFFLSLISLSYVLEERWQEGQDFALEAFGRAPWQSWNRLVLLTAAGGEGYRHEDTLVNAARKIDLPLDHFTTLPIQHNESLRLLQTRLETALSRYSE